MKDEILKRARLAVREKVFPGCVVGVVRRDGSRLVVPCGRLTYEAGAPEVSEQTIYDCASLTKVLPTASLALQLIDEDKLKLTDKLIDYVPEFRTHYADEVLIKHLLTQTVDYDLRLSEFKDKSPDKILQAIFTAKLKGRPGTTFFYSNASSILLGLVVERILKKPLDLLGAEHFFEPLAMARTGFHPLKKFSEQEIAPTEIQVWRGGLVHGEVHDESAYSLSREHIVGSAGLFSTAPDLLNFLQMIVNGGEPAGRRYFSPEIITQIQTNQLADIDAWAGLGWELNQPRYMGKFCGEHTIGKTGFTGCVLIADIPRGAAIVILSNFTYPERKPDGLLINQFRSGIADIIFAETIK